MREDKYIEIMQRECLKGNHSMSEWTPFDDLEDERHCVFCSQTEYRL